MSVVGTMPGAQAAPDFCPPAWHPKDWGGSALERTWIATVAHLRLSISGSTHRGFHWEVVDARTNEWIVWGPVRTDWSPQDARRQAEAAAARVLGHRTIENDVATKTGRRSIAAELKNIAYDIERVFGCEVGNTYDDLHPAQCLIDELTDIAERLKE